MAYDIFFRGEALDGHDLALVKQQLGKLFKASDEKLVQLFSGKVIPLKKQLSKDEALKYQQLFKKAGAKIYIKASPQDATPSAPTQTADAKAAEPSAPAAAAKNPEPTTAAQNSPQQTAAPSALQALPVGSEVLSASEREQGKAQSVKVDTSSISLAAQGPLPTIEKVFAQAPDTSHLSASISATPLQESSFQAKDVDTSKLSLAEAGGKLLDYYDDIPTPPPKLDHLSLAEQGPLPTPEKPKAQAPDTSHLSVAPNR